MRPFSRLHELYRFIFSSRSQPISTPKSAVGQATPSGEQAVQAREEARQAYLDAIYRRDTRDIHETERRFVQATAECLRLAL